MRTEYTSAYGLSVEKTYATKDGSTLSSGDTVEVRIRIRNTGNTLAKDIHYLDTIPQIFDATNTTRYNITLDGKTEERNMLPLS